MVYHAYGLQQWYHVALFGKLSVTQACNCVAPSWFKTQYMTAGIVVVVSVAEQGVLVRSPSTSVEIQALINHKQPDSSSNTSTWLHSSPSFLREVLQLWRWVPPRGWGCAGGHGEGVACGVFQVWLPQIHSRQWWPYVFDQDMSCCLLRDNHHMQFKYLHLVSNGQM